MTLFKFITKIVWWMVRPYLIMVLIVFVTCASIKAWQDVKEQPEENYTMTYHNNRILKTEYTLKEVSEGVYVIRKGE